MRSITPAFALAATVPSVLLASLAAAAMTLAPSSAAAATPHKAPRQQSRAKAPAASAKPATTPPAGRAVATASAVKPPPPPSTSPSAQLHLDVQRVTLENGLRVVMSVDHTAPTVAVDVVYDVGSRQEERGRSGFAHLFEHMMFQGSANVPRGDHFKLVTAHGGTLNGTTNADRTNYFELMPSSELPLALWLEADRMKSLDVSESNLDNQRSVVKEEYRMRVENQAYVPADLRLSELVFQGYFPYEHSTIGSLKDLDAAQLDWVRAFHDAYYAPNNAILSIAGDFDPAEAMTLVRQYFGPAKAQPSIPKYAPGELPLQDGPRDEVVEDPHARFPAIFYGWSIPKNRDPEHYALELATMILSGGESSRLYRTLVRERALAVDVSMNTDDHRGPDVLEASVKLSDKATPDQIDKIVESAIAGIARTAPTTAEMNKVRNQLRAHFLFGLESNFARAQQLAEFELYFGDANLLNSELDRFLAVTPDDVKRAVSKYLTRARRSRVEVRPAAASAASPEASAEGPTPKPKAAPAAPAAKK